MNSKTLENKLFRDRPAHLTKSEYRKLMRSLLIPPSRDYEWFKNNAGEWERVRI